MANNEGIGKEPEGQRERPERLRGRVRIVGPAILVGAGVLLLLNNLGALPWSVWGSLWRLWPVVLILIGLEILLNRSGMGQVVAWSIGAIAVIAVGAVIVLGALGYWGDWRGWPAVATGGRYSGHMEKELRTLQEADVLVAFGAGDFRLGALDATSGKLLEGEYVVRGVERAPEVGLEASNGKGRLEISAESGGWPGGPGDEWRLRLSPRIPLDLTIKVGAISGEMDLSALKVRRLNLDVGASSVKVRFPESAGQSMALVKAGVADITLEIPEEVGARILTASGITSQTFAPRYVRQRDGYYLSTNWDTARNRIELEVKTGVSSVTIR